MSRCNVSLGFSWKDSCLHVPKNCSETEYGVTLRHQDACYKPTILKTLQSLVNSITSKKTEWSAKNNTQSWSSSRPGSCQTCFLTFVSKCFYKCPRNWIEYLTCQDLFRYLEKQKSNILKSFRINWNKVEMSEVNCTE